MQATVSKWGHSLALRLPRHVVNEMRLAEGAAVTIEVENGSLRVTPTRKKFKLAELLENEKPGKDPREHDWGKTEGEEAW